MKNGKVSQILQSQFFFNIDIMNCELVKLVTSHVMNIRYQSSQYTKKKTRDGPNHSPEGRCFLSDYNMPCSAVHGYSLRFFTKCTSPPPG